MIELGERIASVLAIDPSAPAIEFGGRWRTWGELASTVESVSTQLPVAGTRIGVLLRNRPAAVAFVLGSLRAGACIVAIDPQRGADRVRREIAALELPYVAGEPGDLANGVGPETAATTLTLPDLGGAVAVARHAGGAGRPLRPGVAVQMLTSGTTGQPKRVDLSYEMLGRSLSGAKHYESQRDAELRLRSGVAIIHAPLVHVAGLFRVVQCAVDGRSFALLERFTVDGWVDAVRRHRPATASLVPAALRMVLEADIAPADLGSIRSVISGTAPLSAADADAFTAKYGIPVLASYGATEFGGGVAGWNLVDHQRFWAAKRGSVGRAHPGCELRVIDPQSGGVLDSGAEGLLEVKAAQLGAGSAWVRTTDLARIDADGFLWILGRADQVIIRGGFKVRPDDVRAALERHPRVRGAAVVSRPDPRLGAVPVAAVELRRGPDPITPDDLLAHASATLARYELPAEIRIVDELPRTASAKVDLAAVTTLFGEA
ncbi:MAG: long-chain fatty acid--CoA ligase [Deltaproteobacteria bacterium]|nr:MAG: long-chain fatty acid--CoA ligase [Deltaproteobacteria bacterium]